MSSNETPVPFFGNYQNVAITKEMLKTAQVIGQVDFKFIASTLKNSDSRYLILFDQHAVDERLQLEHLQRKYKLELGDLKRTKLSFPVSLIVKARIEAMSTSQEELEKILASSGIICLIKNDSNALFVSITEFPLVLLRKVIRRSNYLDYVDYVKEAVTKIILNHVNGDRSSCTNLFNNALASEACARAVKFGDSLNHTMMVNMLARLVQCDMPFQCAHGRPTLSVINQLPQNNKSQLPPSIFKITR